MGRYRKYCSASDHRRRCCRVGESAFMPSARSISFKLWLKIISIQFFIQHWCFRAWGISGSQITSISQVIEYYDSCCIKSHAVVFHSVLKFRNIYRKSRFFKRKKAWFLVEFFTILVLIVFFFLRFDAAARGVDPYPSIEVGGKSKRRKRRH